MFETLADPDPSAGTRVDLEAMKKRVRETVEGLNPLDREVLVLRSLDELSFAEVAAALGIEEGTAKVRHYRAKLRFEEAFSAGGRLA